MIDGRTVIWATCFFTILIIAMVAVAQIAVRSDISNLASNVSNLQHEVGEGR